MMISEHESRAVVTSIVHGTWFVHCEGRFDVRVSHVRYPYIPRHAYDHDLSSSKYQSSNVQSRALTAAPVLRSLSLRSNHRSKRSRSGFSMECTQNRIQRTEDAQIRDYIAICVCVMHLSH